MSLKLGVKTNNRKTEEALAPIVSTFEATRSAATAASNRALRESARWFVSQAKKEIASQTRLPRKTLKMRAGKLVHSSIRITADLSPIRAKFLGPLTQLKTGAKAGPFFFHGAFVATMHASRGPSVYRRKGRERFPVSEQGVPINEKTRSILENLMGELPNYYEKRWDHHLNFLKEKE